MEAVTAPREPAEPRATIEAPPLLISGGLDPITPPALAEEARQYLPSSVHVVVPGGGHSPVNECTSGVVASFLKQGPGGVATASCPG